MSIRRPIALLLLTIAALSTSAALRGESALWTAHKSDNVAWRKWNPEVIQEAKDTDKPLFFFAAHFGNSLASAMLAETFQNDTISSTLNETAIPILVDVNDQPELASLLSLIVFENFETRDLPICLWTDAQLLPLNGGGYFPPTDDWGGQGFLSLTRNVAEQWETRREDLIQPAGERLEKAIAVSKTPLSELADPTNLLTPDIFTLEESPSLPALEFYLGSKALPILPSDQASTLRVAMDETLSQISDSAGFDSISGGFFIGANDPNWKLPLFQKSAADQALMLSALSELHLQSPNPRYLDLIRLTVAFIQRDLIKSNGLSLQYLSGFAPGETSDTAEGSYYLINTDQLENLSTEAATAWNLSPDGNLDSDTDILGLYQGVSVPFPQSPTVLTEQFDSLRSLIQSQRAAKKSPNTDSTGYTATNAFIISALIRAHEASGDPSYLDLAKKIYNKILENTLDSGKTKLFNSDSKTVPASSLDYASLAAAALDLHQSAGDAEVLATARKIYEIWAHDERFQASNRLQLPTSIDGITAAAYKDAALPAAATLHFANLQRFATLDRAKSTSDELNSIAKSIPHLAETYPDAFRSLLLFSLLAQRESQG